MLDISNKGNNKYLTKWVIAMGELLLPYKKKSNNLCFNTHFKIKDSTINQTKINEKKTMEIKAKVKKQNATNK